MKFYKTVIFRLGHTEGQPERTEFVKYEGDNPTEVKTAFYAALKAKKKELGKMWEVNRVSPDTKDMSAKSMVTDMPGLIDTDELLEE